GKNLDIKLEVEVPKFVRMLKKWNEIKEYGPTNTDFVVGNIEFAIDTAVAGEFKGEISVTLGQAAAKLPVSATVKDVRQGLRRVRVVDAPFERYSADDGTMFRVWTDLVKDSPLNVSYLLAHRGEPVLRDLDLEKFDCILLGPGGLFWATTVDVKRVWDYAEKGGRVLVAANRSYWNSIAKANLVVVPYGLTMHDQVTRRTSQEGVTLGKDDIDASLVKAGVQSLRFRGPSPIEVTDASKSRVLVLAYGVHGPAQGFVARAQAGKGEVVAIGESLWWHWISKEQAKE